MASELDIQEVRPKLFLGSREAARDVKALANLRITHVLSVGTEFPGTLALSNLDEKQRAKRCIEGRSTGGRLYLQEGGKKDPFVRLCLPVEDADSEDIAQHFDECRLFISEGLGQGKVLLHCTEGRSRSVAMLVSFLMHKEKLCLGKALVAVKEKRPAAAPRAAFLKQLQSLEERLGLEPASPRTLQQAGLLGSGTKEAVNPQVFLEICVDGQSVGRIVIELFADTAPQTAENFRCLCTGERGRGLSGKRLNYLGSIFHKIIPGFLCVGGDFTMGDGTGGESIYGSDFKDENFEVKHSERGVISMANSGTDSNGSQFVICFRACPELDDKNVAFGKIVSGLDVLEQLEALGSEDGAPKRRATILDCGEEAQPGRAVKRPKIAIGELAHVLHVLRKHKGVKKASSWREEVISCSREEAAGHLQGLREGLSGLDAGELRKKFEALASQHSDCKSAKKGGDLGPFEPGMMKKDFEAACFALKVGELSKVVSTKQGEHLIFRIK
eukprot:TRINITY_DN30828_c0_g1_i1.p1 TRINITY_DN30828_c0_g1~~TRINITY_DN30828_c0_g1_i1.p1  ORF type:complete len:509 (-),score=111.19 TRINITY_DN30828_c0_g1_i1:94-1593(-)